jgi:hypothetical protein
MWSFRLEVTLSCSQMCCFSRLSCCKILVVQSKVHNEVIADWAKFLLSIPYCCFCPWKFILSYYIATLLTLKLTIIAGIFWTDNLNSSLSSSAFKVDICDFYVWFSGFRSVFCGGSTGFFIYGYCYYYYFVRSDMTGLMQTSFFFGYMGCVCYGFFLMLGSVGYRASLVFVRHIYRAIKCE